MDGKELIKTINVRLTDFTPPHIVEQILRYFLDRTQESLFCLSGPDALKFFEV
jgi:hypothetical protein